MLATLRYTSARSARHGNHLEVKMLGPPPPGEVPTCTHWVLQPTAQALPNHEGPNGASNSTSGRE